MVIVEWLWLRGGLSEELIAEINNAVKQQGVVNFRVLNLYRISLGPLMCITMHVLYTIHL